MPERGASGAQRVTRTGIALVHEGELVLPAAGSEAQAARVSDDVRSTIHYYFPVEIEVISGGQTIDPQEIADLALERLARSIRANQI